MSCVTHLAPRRCIFYEGKYLLREIYGDNLPKNNMISLFGTRDEIDEISIADSYREAPHLEPRYVRYVFLKLNVWNWVHAESSFDRRYRFRAGVNIRSVFFTRSIAAYFNHKPRSSLLNIHINTDVFIGIPKACTPNDRVCGDEHTRASIRANKYPGTYDSSVVEYCTVLDNIWIIRLSEILIGQPVSIAHRNSALFAAAIR